MRHRGTKCECAHEQAHQQAHVSLGPGSRHLHADRIDAGHAKPGYEAKEDDPKGIGWNNQDKRIGACSDERRRHEETPRVEPIRQAKDMMANYVLKGGNRKQLPSLVATVP